MQMENEAKAQEWQQVILEVASGRTTATAAAARMGVSRKTYYEKQDRALAAMLEALQDRPTGRPGKAVDPEKAELLEELAASRKTQAVLAARLRIQEAIRQTMLESGANSSADKKKRTV